jgi:DNA-binding HxlR family transcriptional regulator
MLEAQGIVRRESYPQSPPRVEYQLTDKGVAMLPIIEAMRGFGHSWLIDEHDHEHVERAPRGVAEAIAVVSDTAP